MPTPSIQTLVTDAQQVLNLDSISAVRSVVAVALANANAGTPLNPNLTTQQLWNEFYQVVTKPKSDIESIIANQLMKFLYAPPAPGGAGANGQVIFNDNGVLAGDPQFLWNKTTNLLTITGAATISGNLTVDTNTLFADAANNRVGIGTATPATPLNIGTAVSRHFLANGQTTGSSYGEITTTGGDAIYGVVDAAAGLFTGAIGNASFFGSGNATPLQLVTNSISRAVIDSSGNLGLGVTPSAWNSYYKVLQLSTIGSYIAANTTSYSAAPFLFIGNNAYGEVGSGFKYTSSQPSAQYRQENGVHQWFNAPSGTAGNAITFTQAMTLDASGNLLVGKTAVSGTTLGAQLQSNGAIASGMVEQTNAALNLLVYSTGAAASRFYVGMGGTVYATNTTISAISDARLKENVQDIDVGLGAILALKPRKFDWKEGKGKNIKGDRGFIAQEFETVFPNLIDEWKDEAPEGEAPYKSVRQDLIPVLVKAIQELAAEVNALKNA